MFDRAMTLDESCALCHFGFGVLDYWEADTAKRGIQRLTKAITQEDGLLASTRKAPVPASITNAPAA